MHGAASEHVDTREQQRAKSGVHRSASRSDRRPSTVGGWGSRFCTNAPSSGRERSRWVPCLHRTGM
jgi:hypothetical protein